MLRVKAGAFPKFGDGVVIEAGPTAFPALEVRHPVGNVDVDAVDAGGGYLAHSFHVNFAPLWCVGTHPDVFVALGNPERRAAAENGRLSGELALQPIRMVLGECVRTLVGVGGDALGSGDVNESMIAGTVRGLRHGADRL